MARTQGAPWEQTLRASARSTHGIGRRGRLLSARGLVASPTDRAGSRNAVSSAARASSPPMRPTPGVARDRRLVARQRSRERGGTARGSRELPSATAERANPSRPARASGTCLRSARRARHAARRSASRSCWLAPRGAPKAGSPSSRESGSTGKRPGSRRSRRPSRRALPAAAPGMGPSCSMVC